jgi:hypothetical protein
MAKTTLALVASAACLAGAPLARAVDPWETDDDTAATTNLMRPGDVQFGHDLEGPPADRDFAIVLTKARHSYEARTNALFWEPACTAPVCECTMPVCAPNFDRVSPLGAVLTPGAASSEDPRLGGGSIGRTVRWIASADQFDLLRVSAVSVMGTDVYDVAFSDTTLVLPRWNNTATQSTLVLLQNTTNSTVTGFAYFHDAAGNLLATEAVSVPQHGLQIIPTAAIAALAGQSGSALIAQTGGYAALLGKGVSLEPGTGFTFDTPILPLPH